MAARQYRSSSANRLRWCCKRDYRRTDERPINSLLIWEEGTGKRRGGKAHTRWQPVSVGKTLPELTSSCKRRLPVPYSKACKESETRGRHEVVAAWHSWMGRRSRRRGRDRD